jgi:hypothetical protein
LASVTQAGNAQVIRTAATIFQSKDLGQRRRVLFFAVVPSWNEVAQLGAWYDKQCHSQTLVFDGLMTIAHGFDSAGDSKRKQKLA